MKSRVVGQRPDPRMEGGGEDAPAIRRPLIGGGGWWWAFDGEPFAHGICCGRCGSEVRVNAVFDDILPRRVPIRLVAKGELLDNGVQNWAGSCDARDAFHLATIRVAHPDANGEGRCVSESPVVSKTGGCSGFTRHGKIEV